ncbi:uncharacterized protein LOC121430973 isoform X2 [Lytechinus variegatus]|uniref:uncharacterized protein LOC121430973 isoform X2 n=1 Tax=Lytechinus variegatus TaxID=7654 RepID=UPI001BB17E4E|nr:uncharacterized protein LOC121430973 isoform X2 [Lytechinus variegatus]
MTEDRRFPDSYSPVRFAVTTCTKTLHAWYGRAQFVDPDNCSYLSIFQSTESASDMEESASIMSESTSVMTESSATMSRSTSVMTDRSEAMSSSISVFTGIPSIKTESSMSSGFKTTLSSTQMTSYLTSSEREESSTPVAQHQLRTLSIAIPLLCITIIILVMSMSFFKRRRRRRPPPDNGVRCRQLPHPNQTPSNVANVANCVTLETNDESAYHLLHGGRELGDYHTYELADLTPQGGNSSQHQDTPQRPNNTKPFQIFDQSGSNHLREEPASRMKSNCHGLSGESQSQRHSTSHTGMADETANPSLSPDEEYDRLKRPLALDLHTVAGNVYGKLDDPKRSDRKVDGPDSPDYFVLEKQDENQTDSLEYFVLEKQENEIKVDVDRDDHVYFVLK